MSLQSKYSKEVRKELSLFPIWIPGAKVEPGDIGTINKGIFERQTSLAQMYPDLKFKVTQSSLSTPFRFVSKDSHAATISGSAQMPTGSLPANVDATVEVRFGSKGGVVFSANGITQYSIDNLHEVRSFLEEQRSTWPHGYVLAGTIHRAQKFTVLVSDEEGVTATLSGDADALKQFDLAHASVSVKSMSSNGYQTQGLGAVTLRTYGFNLFGYGSKLLSDDEKPPSSDDFIEVSARDPNFD